MSINLRTYVWAIGRKVRKARRSEFNTIPFEYRIVSLKNVRIIFQNVDLIHENVNFISQMQF